MWPNYVKKILVKIKECSCGTIFNLYGSARGVTVFAVDENPTNRVQILNEVVCISHSANTFGKGMKQTILPSAMGK